MAAGGTPGTNTGVGGTGGTSAGGGAGADATGGVGGGGTYGGGGGGGGGSGFTGGGGGNSGAYQHTGNQGGNVSQSFTFTNPTGSIISGGIGGQGSTAYGSGGGGGGGAGIGGGGGGGGGGYGLGGGGGGGGGGAGVGGGGGAGGYGAGGVGGPGGNMTGTVSITNNGKIYGGAGAAGVNYSLNPAQHGTAGNGGDAIGFGGAGGLGGGASGPGGVGGGITGLAVTIINTGLLQGGNGGGPSPTGITDGGIGGVGIRGSNLTIVNSGTIAGGFDGNTGTVRSNSILFTGGTNSLELQSGWVISGDVSNASGVTGTANTLILGGNTTNLAGNGTAAGTIFDVSQVGVKYQNFDAFQKSGVSIWQLTSATGAVTPWTITGGTLQISSDAALGGTNGSLTFGGTDADTGLPSSGTLEVTANTTSARNITLNNIAGFANLIQVASGVTYTTTTGVVGGTGALTKTGAGTLVLDGNNTYMGGTTIVGGTVQLSNDAGLGNTNGTLTFGGIDPNTGLAGSGTLAVTATTSTTRNVLLNNIAGFANTIDVSGTNDYTIGGVVSGQGALTKANSGTLTLTGNNAYSGGTTVSAGTLQLGNGGTSGSITGNVTDNGTLAFNRSDVYTFGGVISGTGSLSQIGPGTTILTANNTYGGGTTIGAGTLQLGNGGATGSIMGNVVDDGTLAFDRSDVVAFGGTVSGTGAVRQIGSGTTTLMAATSYSGSTSVENGTLKAGASAVFSPNSAFTVTAAGTLDASGFDQTVKSLANAGVVATNAAGTSAGTTLTVTGNYVGQGGMLRLNTVLGADNSVTDKLVVDGDASGSTLLVINNVGGTGARTLADGIEVVEVKATSTSNAFHLNNALTVGAYDYALYYGGIGADAGNQNWYLRTTGLLTASAQTTLPYADVLTYFAQDTLGTLQQRTGNRIWPDGTADLPPNRATNNAARPEIYGQGAWARIGGQYISIDPKSGTPYTLALGFLQGGYEGVIKETAAGDLTFGAYATVGTSRADIDVSRDPVSGTARSGKITTTGYGLGTNLTWLGNNGLYADAIGQLTFYDSSLSNKIGGDNRGWSGAASLEVGKRYDLAAGWSMVPQAQLVYTHVDFSSFTDLNGSHVALGNGDSLNGRLGVRVENNTSWNNASGKTDRLQFYGIANLNYSFLKASSVVVAGAALEQQDKRLWGEVGLGGTYARSDNWSLYGEADYAAALSAGSHSNYAIKGTTGLRYNW